jgi:hypothetical protein
MPFHRITRSLIRQYTHNTPPSKEHWYTPWASIIRHMFSSSDNYVVYPRRVRAADNFSVQHIPDLVVEAIGDPNNTIWKPRTVLIVTIENSEFWESGKDALMQRIKLQTEWAFARRATERVYWVVEIGPHWRYGIKEDDGQDLRPLIPWHDVTHDDASYDDLMRLANLVTLL